MACMGGPLKLSLLVVRFSLHTGASTNGGGMQKLNCSPGDLAIAVTALVPENIGQIVEIVGLPQKKWHRLNGCGHIWWVRTPGGRKTLCYEWPDGTVRRYAEGPVFDHRLRRLAGPRKSGGSTHEDENVNTIPADEVCA